MPAAAARRAASSASRVLPIPGSPATNATRPRPPRAPARNSVQRSELIIPPDQLIGGGLRVLRD